MGSTSAIVHVANAGERGSEREWGTKATKTGAKQSKDTRCKTDGMSAIANRSVQECASECIEPGLHSLMLAVCFEGLLLLTGIYRGKNKIVSKPL